MKPVLFVVGIAFFAVAPLAAQTPWIHVEVDESDGDQAQVQVNLPLSVVRIAMRAAPEKFIRSGHLHLSHFDRDVNVDDLRQLWMELRSSGDSEFVTVEDDDERVRIRRDGDYIRIDVEELSRVAPEQVRVDIPVGVVDALFAGDGDTLDLEGALTELGTARGNVVSVDDGDTKIRVWIDEKD